MKSRKSLSWSEDHREVTVMLSLQTDPRQYNQQQQQQQQLLISRVLPYDGVTVGDERIDSSFPFQSESALSSGNSKSELSREGGNSFFLLSKLVFGWQKKFRLKRF